MYWPRLAPSCSRRLVPISRSSLTSFLVVLFPSKTVFLSLSRVKMSAAGFALHATSSRSWIIFFASPVPALTRITKGPCPSGSLAFVVVPFLVSLARGLLSFLRSPSSPSWPWPSWLSVRTPVFTALGRDLCRFLVSRPSWLACFLARERLRFEALGAWWLDLDEVRPSDGCRMSVWGPSLVGTSGWLGTHIWLPYLAAGMPLGCHTWPSGNNQYPSCGNP